MKTKALKTEKKENTTFAFLPEMVLDHLNEAKPTETTKENSNESIIEKITITADPEIPNLDSIYKNIVEPIIVTTAEIKKKEERKPIETVDETTIEAANSETQENIITRFLKKIKH